MRDLLTCVAAGIWTTLTDTHLEAVKSGEGVEVEVVADSGIETRTEIETGIGRRLENGNAREIVTRTTGTETGEIRIAGETWTEIAIGTGTDGIGIERGTVTVTVIAIETAIETGSGVIGIGIGTGTEIEIENEIGRGTGATGGTGVCHLGEIDGIVAGAVVELSRSSEDWLTDVYGRDSLNDTSIISNQQRD